MGEEAGDGPGFRGADARRGRLEYGDVFLHPRKPGWRPTETPETTLCCRDSPHGGPATAQKAPIRAKYRLLFR